MNKLIPLFCLLMIALSVRSEEAGPADTPAPAKTEAPPAEVVPETTATQKAPEPAAAEPTSTEKKESPVTKESAPPEIVPDAAVTAEKPAPAVAADPVQPAQAPSAKTPEKEKPVGRLASLEPLTAFHEKELASLREMIGQWNVKLGETLKRQKGLKDDLSAKETKAKTLEQTGTKASKTELKVLKKEISGIQKSLQSIEKEIGTQYKTLANEIKEKSALTAESLQTTVRQVIEEIQKPSNK